MTYVHDLNLDKEQFHAATYDINANLQIIAGPGTGKTRALTGRVAHLLESGVEARNILVLSFTNQAMRAFQIRLNSIIGENSKNVHVFTFHAFCQALLRSHGSYLQAFDSSSFKWTIPWSVADSIDQEQLLTHIRRHNADSKFIPRSSKTALHQINQQKSRCLTDPDWKETPLVSTYNRELHNVQLLDYNDLLFLGGKLVADFGEKFLNYTHILVDEFQDTAPVKWDFLKSIIQKTNAPLTVVGDPRQSIFSFQGVDGKVFDVMKSDFPDTQAVELLTNHRSSKQIVALSNELLANYAHLQGTFDGPQPVYMEFDDSNQESRWISNEIEHVLAQNPSMSMKDFAILSRTNLGVNTITSTFDRISKLPTVSFGSAYVLLHQPGIMVLYTALKIIESRQHIYNSHSTPVDIATLALLQNKSSGPILTVQRSRELWELSKKKKLPVSESLRSYSANCAKQYKKNDRLTQFCNFLDWAKVLLSGEYTHKEIWQVLDRLISMWSLKTKEESYPVSRLYKIIKELSDIRVYSKESLLQFVTDNVRLQSFADTPDKLVSSTIHNAKGLEWPFVFITGLTDGNIPLEAFPGSDVNYDEERRLLYVAMTRGIQKIYLTRSKNIPSKPIKYGRYPYAFRIPQKSRYLNSNVMKHFEKGRQLPPASLVSTTNVESYLKAKRQYSKLFQVPESAKIVQYFSTLTNQMKKRIL